MESSPAGGAPTPPVDLAVALRFVGGDRALLADLVEVFRTERAGRVDALRRALSAGDAATVQRTAHSLKSALGILGAGAARKLAADLEALGRADRLSEAPDVLAALEPALAAVVAFFEASP